MNRSYNRSHANRGSKLEMMVDMVHNQYRNSGKADIRKVPTPVKILKVEGNKVTGHLDKAAWVDYSGIYKGKSIIFDAKETKIQNFPLKNLSDQQYELLCSWSNHGAVAFLLVAFWLPGKNEPEIYVLYFEQLRDFWTNKDKGGSKSIPIAFFREECIRTGTKNGFVIDYLSDMFLQ